MKIVDSVHDCTRLRRSPYIPMRGPGMMNAGSGFHVSKLLFILYSLYCNSVSGVCNTYSRSTFGVFNMCMCFSALHNYIRCQYI
jgi:hypothetical protein